MAKAKSVTIYHNPKCTTSCNVLAMIEDTGVKPTIVEYLKTGWTKVQLKELFAAAGITAREALRTQNAEKEAPELLESGVSEAKILDAMVANPVLVNRPIVATSKATALCRPKEKVRDLLG